MKFLSALIGALVLAGAASAQDDRYTPVKNLIRDNVESDEKLVGQMQAGELSEGEYDSFTLRIDPKKAYIVYATCDFDCTDLDLVGGDDTGYEADSDTEDDDVPVIVIMPGALEDELMVTVYMEGCDAEDECVWAAGVYEQPD